jgi:hypothetical protein
MIEWYNPTLLASLSMMVKKNQKDWDEQLPFAMMAYRYSVHCTTHETPYYMTFGREMILLIDTLYGDPNEEEADVTEYTTERKQRLETTFQNIREHLGSQHRKQKRAYDQRQHGKPYDVGDFVWVHGLTWSLRGYPI